MKLEAQRLRLARVLLVGVLALLTAPAVAQAAGPERAPANGPSRLGPEPAPTAAPAPPPSVTTNSTSSSASQVTTTTPSRPVVATPTPASTRQQPPASSKPQAHQPPPEPKATHAVKAAVRTIAHRIEKPASGIALVAVPTTTSDSNRLLFLGGLALLFLVLGDAAFLAISARAIREDR